MRSMSVFGLLLLLIIFGSVSAADRVVDDSEVIQWEGPEIDGLTVLGAQHDIWGDSLYVFRGTHRLWKSPKSTDFPGFAPPLGDLQHKDVDGNGISDILWIINNEQRDCFAIRILVSLNRGEHNYLLRYRQRSESDPRQPGGRGFLESSNPPPTEDLWRQLAPILRKLLKGGCDGKEIENLISKGNYQIINPRGMMDELRRAHSEAVSLYKNYKVTRTDIKEARRFSQHASVASIPVSKALTPLLSIFMEYDYREVDPENRDQGYTQILNDYGFLLEQYGDLDGARNVIRYVARRDPAWRYLKPMARPREYNKLPPHARDPKHWIGSYFLEGEMEVAAVLRLDAKGGFRYSVSYGAYDGYARGTWVLSEDGYIILNSTGVYEPPRFVLKHSEKNPDDRLSVLVQRNGEGMPGVDVTIRFDGERRSSGYTQYYGLQVPLSGTPRSIGLGMRMFDVDLQWFETDSRVHNHFVFEFLPGSLGEIRFIDLPLRVERNSLFVEHAEYGGRFVKR